MTIFEPTNKLDKKYTEFERSYPEELEIFSLKNIFESKRHLYSSTSELYDLIPKYFNSENVRKVRQNGKYIDIIIKDFVYKKQKMTLYVTPAKLLQSDRTSKDFLPSSREQIIEDVLRKFATDPDRNEFLDDRLTARFTLYEIWKELRAVKHPYDYDQIKESLMIMAKTNIEIRTQDGKIAFCSNMFETFGIKEENSDSCIGEMFVKHKDNHSKKIIYFVRFNSLITDSIKNKSWRILNYVQYMHYKSAFSRWLHKRISYMFWTNNIEKPYVIMLSTIIRDSGMLNCKQLRDSKIRAQTCLKEMIKVGSIIKYEMETVYFKNNAKKIEDVKFSIYISGSFLSDLILNVYKDKEYREFKETTNIMNDKEIQSIGLNKFNDEKYQLVRNNINNLLKSINLSEKDIWFFFQEVSYNKLLKIENNIKSAIEYINYMHETHQNCNNLAITIASITENWKLNKNNYKQLKIDNTIIIKTSLQKNKEEKQQKKDWLSKIEDKRFKKIMKALLDYYDYLICKNYISLIQFVSLENNCLYIKVSNGIIFDEINRYYFKSAYNTGVNGEKIFITKGIVEIIKETYHKIKSVHFSYDKNEFVSHYY